MHLNEFLLRQCSSNYCEVMNSIVFHEKGFLYGIFVLSKRRVLCKIDLCLLGEGL